MFMKRKTHFLLELLFLFVSMCAYAQNKEIVVTGIVTDVNEEALIGASVLVKGTGNGTITGVDGRFSLKVANPNATLEISSVGYTTKRVDLKKRTSIKVLLEEDVEMLDEVVVIGYGSMKKSDLTGSVSSIKSDDIDQVKGGSFLESMQGKIAGVMVSSSSGEPGAGIDISIRGANSINAGCQPLYIIDGMQVDVNSSEIASNSYGNSATYNPLSSIDQNDIESIEVLKDASATAIYGSRGANGVVLVTTKSGNSNKSAVHLNMRWGLSNVMNRLDMLGGQEYVDYCFSRQPGVWGKDTDGDGVEDIPMSIEGATVHDWQDEVYRTALTQSYSVSYDGGNQKTSFSSSVGYLNQQGVVKKNDFTRYTARVKVEHKANKYIQLGTNINFSYQENKGITSSGGNGQFWGILQSIIMFRPVTPLDMGEIPVDDPVNAGMSDPMSFINDAKKTNSFTRLMADAFANIKFTKHLSFRTQVNGNFTFSEDKGWYPKNTSWGNLSGGKNMLTTANSLSWQNSNVLTYQRVFNKKHSLNVMLGAECSEYNIRTTGIQVDNFPIDGDMSDMIDMGVALPNMPRYTHNRSTRASLFGRVNYVFDNRYLFTTTIRRDGSSKFGKNNKYAYFPSVAFAWRISNEKFMENISAISNMKLRLTYGVTGNDRIPYYQSMSRTENSYSSTVSGKGLGLALSTLPNPDLKWETTHQYNVGLDLGFLKNRISVNADLYYKRTTDMLLNADVASQIGSYKQWQNIGSVDNKGLEIGLSTVNIRNRNFSWSTDLNFNMNRNKVRSLGNVSFIPVQANGTQMKNVGRVIVGESIGTGYGYVWDGIYQVSDFIDVENGTLKEGVPAFSGNKVSPGTMKFKSLDGDMVVDAIHDQKVISHSEPKHFGGMNNKFSYKGFDLAIFFQWSYGNEILNIARLKTEGRATANSNITKDAYYNFWTPDNQGGIYPRVDDPNSRECSTYYVEDGSYLRLKNVTLGYQIPKKMLRKVGISSARVYVSGDNLLTFTNYSGIDPEVSYHNGLLTGLDNQVYPRARTFNFGINLNF